MCGAWVCGRGRCGALVMVLVRGAESVDVALQWEARERRGHLQGERGPVDRHTMGGRFKREGVGRGA